MTRDWRRIVADHPLITLLGIGLAFRLVAAVWAGGYFATDDHTQVIEIAARWLRGRPFGMAEESQYHRSLFYPGLNYLGMWLLNAVGIAHPGKVMLINRLVHAAFSLWTIVIVYRLTRLLADKTTAYAAGMMAAIGVLMPYLAVRNLIEVVSGPFLLYGLYQLVLAEREETEADWRWLVAGISLGLAFIIRWQVASALVGIGLYQIWKRQWRGLLLTIAGASLPIVGQGIWDFAWHGTFMGSLALALRNAATGSAYVPGPWYRYLNLTLGIFLPPFSILFLIGMVRFARRMSVVPWATFAFFIIHSILTEKQERFLLPILPAMIVLGTVGLWHWMHVGKPLTQRLIRWGWLWFWIITVPLACVVSVNYGQKARVEPLIALYERGDATGVIVDMTEKSFPIPWYYLDGGDSHRAAIPVYPIEEFTELDRLDTTRVNYAIIYSYEHFEEHRDALAERFGRVTVLKHYAPSLIDRLLRASNPRYNHSKESWLCRLGP